MKVLKALSFLFIKFINLFFMPLPVKKNRIVFSSYFSKTPEGNLKCVLDELTRQNIYEIRTLFAKYDKSLAGKIQYFLNMFKEIYYYNTSRLIILEGNSLVLAAIPKKKNVYALQLWHAAGAFKKFGQDSDRIYKIKGLDAAVVSSKSVSGIYADALNIPKDSVYVLGIPRLDPMFDRDRAQSFRVEVVSRHPELQGKKVLLYAPTFRGKGVDDVSLFHVDLQKIADSVGPDYTIAVRLHPLMRGQRLFEGFTDLSYEDLIKSLCAADVLISDYSSIIFEYSALNRPMLFLVPDLQEYIRTRGFYRDYETFVPGKICASESEVIAAVQSGNYEFEKVRAFAAEYLDYQDSESTLRVTGLIHCLMKNLPLLPADRLVELNK